MYPVYEQECRNKYMNKLSLLTDGDAFQVCRQGLSLRLSLMNGL